MDSIQRTTETQIGQTRRGFLQKLVALGAVAVAAPALQVLDGAESAFDAVERLTGDWTKYAKPIIVEATSDKMRFVAELTDRATAIVVEQFRNQMLYGSDRKLWPKPVGRIEDIPYDEALVIRSMTLS